MHPRVIGVMFAAAAFAVVPAIAQLPDGPPVHEQQLLAGDPQAEAWFGENVAIDGDTIAVGARHEDMGTDPNQIDVGAVYIFTRAAAVWSQQQKIEVDPAYYEYGLSYGCTVDISGDTLTIGSYHWNDYRGFVEVWVRDADVWSLQQRLFPGDPVSNHWFGWKAAIDGDSVIVGAFHATSSGSAYVFTRSGAVWTEQQELVSPTSNPEDRFGVWVDIDGDTAVVGDNQFDELAGIYGSAHVFTRTAGSWSLEQSLTSSSTDAQRFGFPVALDGDTLGVGDMFEDVAAADDDAGAAYVFTRAGTVWTEQQRLLPTQPQSDSHFGCGLALEGTTAIVGSQEYDGGPFSHSGAAFVFSRMGGAWKPIATLIASQPGADGNFGLSVAMSGGTAVIGDRYCDPSGINDAGAADVVLIANIEIFADGFESGGVGGWSASSP